MEYLTNSSGVTFALSQNSHEVYVQQNRNVFQNINAISGSTNQKFNECSILFDRFVLI